MFKALALGATAVGIGRPQARKLAAFGQPGVEAVLDIFARELRVVMRQAGTAKYFGSQRRSRRSAANGRSIFLRLSSDGRQIEFTVDGPDQSR